MGSVPPLHYCTGAGSIKPSLLFSFFDVSLAFRGSSLRTYCIFTAAVVMSKRLPVHHHGADYIFWSFKAHSESV